MPYSIAIIGAGPAGLTLARLLLTSDKLSKGDFTLAIFEKDTSRHSRHRLGGTLDLHNGTGLDAIKAAKLWEEFQKVARWEGEELRLCDLNGTTYVHQTEMPRVGKLDVQRPEIDREDLKDLLLDAVSEEIVQWGKGLQEVREDGTLLLTDGTTAGPFDLVVGGDGAWSKVRKVVSDVVPAYSGVCGFAGTITKESAGEDWAFIESMVGRGSNFNFGFGRTLMAQRLTRGEMKMSCYMKRDQQWLERIDKECGKEQDKLRAVMYDEYKDWAPKYQKFIKAVKDIWTAHLWELPVGHSFGHKKGFTLIGDAAHVMTPFAGEGANAAMRDALDLAKAVEHALSSGHDIDEAIFEYEQSMFVRARKFMKDTLVNKQAFFAQDAPCTALSNFVSQALEEMGYDKEKGWISWLPLQSVAWSIFWCWGTLGAFRRMVREQMLGKKY